MRKKPNIFVILHPIRDDSEKKIFLESLLGSSAPMLFASLARKCQSQMLFVLQDAEEAGYFYHDLTQLMGTDQVLFFPSSYRRAVKYAQRDAASEILRTEVLTRLGGQSLGLFVVTYPEALAELVVSKQKLDERTLVLEKDQTIGRFVTLASERWITSMNQVSLRCVVRSLMSIPIVANILTASTSLATISTLSVPLR